MVVQGTGLDGDSSGRCVPPSSLPKCCLLAGSRSRREGLPAAFGLHWPSLAQLLPATSSHEQVGEMQRRGEGAGTCLLLPSLATCTAAPHGPWLDEDRG